MACCEDIFCQCFDQCYWVFTCFLSSYFNSMTDEDKAFTFLMKTVCFCKDHDDCIGRAFVSPSEAVLDCLLSLRVSLLLAFSLTAALLPLSFLHGNSSACLRHFDKMIYVTATTKIEMQNSPFSLKSPLVLPCRQACSLCHTLGHH